MRSLFVIIFIIPLLAACDHIEEDKAAVKAQVEKDADVVADNSEHYAVSAANRVRDSIKKTGEQVRDWWLTPLPDSRPRGVKASYCYRVNQDILCYRAPMPGGEYRLVGYQGTGAETPPVPMMQMLPKDSVDESKLPENRVAATAPVFKEMPEETKEEEKPSDPQAPADAAHEALPDPALAPQL